MKKLILGFLLIFGISSTLFAEVDFIALATNGEFNEQSAGVKVLNEEEMRQVVGGFTQGHFIKQYSITNNFGQKIYTKTYYYANLDAQDKPYFNLLPNEIAGIEEIYNYQTRKTERNIVAIDTRNFIYMRNLSPSLWNRYKAK
ncbi:hypothetical protein [Helicobacter ganmani]|uniref:hypothetical protein n=1 Tax=Helicobacter ganmani TaxID=60246 RepID=UPI003A855C4E